VKTQSNLQEEQQIFIGQLVKKGIEDKSTKAKISALEGDINSCNTQVQSFDEAMTNCKEEIKFLTAIREKMARTASQASAQARETKEELKVKELLILDLTK
jgi:chromosome segregation ATPase